MLIECDRHTAEDLRLWMQAERADAVHAQLAPFERRVDRAIHVIRQFAAAGPCYAGVSWGKDSTVLAHLIRAAGVRVPLVRVVIEPIANPDCVTVRDQFLAEHEMEYHEIPVWCKRSEHDWHATGTLERGFAEAIRRWGDRHLSGVRAAESTVRALTMRRNREATPKTARPIGWWGGSDIFAYLHSRDLPVHPAYAMSGGGMWERDRLRVDHLGLRSGTGRGRHEWEARYYRDALVRIGRAQAGKAE